MGAYFGYFFTYVWIQLFECDDVRSESPVTKRGGGKPLRRLSETQEKEKSVGVLKFNCRFQNCFSSFCRIRKSGLNMKKLQSWKKCPRPKPKYQPLRDTQKLKLSVEWGKYLKIVIEIFQIFHQSCWENTAWNKTYSYRARWGRYWWRCSDSKIWSADHRGRPSRREKRLPNRSSQTHATETFG